MKYSTQNCGENLFFLIKWKPFLENSRNTFLDVGKKLYKDESSDKSHVIQDSFNS